MKENNLTMTTASKSYTDALVSNTYNKLQPQTFLPHCILEVQDSTITIYEYIVSNTIFIDRVAHVQLP